MFDNGHQAAAEFLRCNFPKKQPLRSALPVEEARANERIYSEHVLVEN